MMRNQKKPFDIKRLPLALAVIGCLYGAAVFAQEREEDTDEAPREEAAQLERVTVTGSLLRRAEYDAVSPIQIISADTNVALGQMEVSEFLQKSSIAAGSTQISHQFGAYVTAGGVGAQTLSLRGLGANRTLVLLDGHRPGPAGTRGQVAAFDLNVLPSTIIQRVELLKDGSSSIYGSDAVAGVANVITRKSFDAPEITAAFRAPFNRGGEVFTFSAANGWSFNNGNIVVAGEYYKQEPLQVGDRDFFRCAQDLVTDQNGNSIDRIDRSTLAGTPLGGCSATNLYINTVMDALLGTRYVPSWDGTTIGAIPGYRPRTNANWSGENPAFFNDWLNFDQYGETYIIQDLERMSGYLAADFEFSNVSWNTQLLVNRRESEYKGFRQFFPVIAGRPGSPYVYGNDPDFVNTWVESGVAQPVMPFRSESNQRVDYIYLNTNLTGGLAGSWIWDVNANYTRSDGRYNNLSIDASKTGDWQYGEDAPTINYFDPGFLSGERMDELVGLVGAWDHGKTIYDQKVFTALATGELFELPAGVAGGAIGVEYREFSIDDQPGELSRNGLLWGQSSAQVTKGDDAVKEAFAEIEIPLLGNMPGIENLTLNASGRWFDYDSVGDSDSVWKLGLSWQIVPSLRARATKGTSFRAPGLYELYLGNQSGFRGQMEIDPCIDWRSSNNVNIRANCAAAGIPDDYNGAPSSAQVFTGGGAGFLNPEHSNALTYGIVWTPEFSPISVALDYFEIEVRDQIASLGAGTIVASCYGADVYPNTFCDLFTRAGPDGTEPFKIDNIYATYINLHKQKVKGYDLLTRFQNDYAYGTLTIDSQITYISEDISQTFESPLAGGTRITDWVGDIGRPKLVGNLNASIKRGDFTYHWGMDYVHPTKVIGTIPNTYLGRGGAVYDYKADSRLYHSASLRYEQPKWSLLMGIHNVFNAKPDTISNSLNEGRYGNVPVDATQYDYLGRSLFVRYNQKF